MERNVMFIVWAKYTRFTWWQFSSEFIDKSHLQHAYDYMSTGYNVTTEWNKYWTWLYLYLAWTRAWAGMGQSISKM